MPVTWILLAVSVGAVDLTPRLPKGTIALTHEHRTSWDGIEGPESTQVENERVVVVERSGRIGRRRLLWREWERRIGLELTAFGQTSRFDTDLPAVEDTEGERISNRINAPFGVVLNPDGTIDLEPPEGEPSWWSADQAEQAIRYRLETAPRGRHRVGEPWHQVTVLPDDLTGRLTVALRWELDRIEDRKAFLSFDLSLIEAPPLLAPGGQVSGATGGGQAVLDLRTGLLEERVLWLDLQMTLEGTEYGLRQEDRITQQWVSRGLALPGDPIQR